MLIKMITYGTITYIIIAIILSLLIAYNTWCLFAIDVMLNRELRLCYARFLYEMHNKNNNKLITDIDEFIKNEETPDWKIKKYKNICSNVQDYELIKPYLNKKISYKEITKELDKF